MIPAWLTRSSPHLRSRALWAAIFAFVALVASCAAPSPPPRTAEGVAAMLGAAVGGEVRPDDFVWEARGGFLSDAFLGRQVLFLAKKPGVDQADLYRARVLLTRAGRPLRLRSVRNLTGSPLGDEHDLVAQGHHAAYAVRKGGEVYGITLLDLDGEAEAPRGLAARAAAAVERWLDTGSTRGIGRTEITFATPPPEARHELQGDLLVMALGKDALPAAIDLHDGSLNTGAQNPFGAAAQRIPRRTSALGDVAARTAGELIGDGTARAVQATAGALAAVGRWFAPARRVEDAVEPGGAPAPAGDSFPPPPIAAVVRPPLAGEGVWTAPKGARAAADAPAFAYETAIRPDPRAPDALVRLVALDTRQVDLRLAAGMEEPRPQVGLHGSGRPPEGVPAERLAAVFAGGPAGPAREALGFVSDRRVLATPVRGASSVAITEDGRVAMGTWAFGAEMRAPFVSLRQTPDAILGWSGAPVRPLEGAGEPAERSALGITAGGQLVYAWSARAGTATLARALELAGCTQAVPLAAGPAAAGLAYLAPGAPAQPVSRAMSLGPDQLAGRSAGDLFYVVLRNAAPPAPSGGAAAFTPDAGKQPSPAWLPAVHGGVVTALGAQVHVTTFAPERVAFRVRAGSKEPATKAVAALPGALVEADQPRLVAAIGMGSGKRRGARGLVIDGAVGLPVRGEDTGVLAVDHGRPRILKSAELAPAPGVDASELPLTADDGKLRPEARDVGSMRARAAACVLADGTFAVASTTFDSDEASTTALLDLGCSRVVGLDRGSHASAFLHRAGTETPPQARYEGSALFVLEVPLSGRAAPLDATR